MITGEVNYTINLDPSIWTFDERRFPLSEKFPQTEGTAIELNHFLAHADIKPTASKIICHRGDQEPVPISIAEANDCYLCFAINDQPIKEQGPVKLYLADGSNLHHPIDQITKFEVVS